MNKQKKYKPPDYISGLADAVYEKRGGRLGVPMRDAALQANISFATLSRIERGSTPDLDTFRKLCIWLGKSADDILGLGE